MEPPHEFDFGEGVDGFNDAAPVPKSRTTNLDADSRRIGVHVLSEHVFCPRAALLAWESAPDCGDDDLFAGPRLDGVIDYNEHRFVEAVQQAWGDFRLWLTLMAPAAFVPFIAWRVHSVFAAIVVSLPMLYVGARLWDTLQRITMLVREKAIYDAAVPAEIELPLTRVTEVSWWSLRKAGFDCFKLKDALWAPGEPLIGKPWRVLKKGNTIGVPVILRRGGKTDWGPQHEVRVSAYCRLIERCEGRSAPFGVILFAGTYDCVLIPNTGPSQFRCDSVIAEVQSFLKIHAQGTHIPAAPIHGQCAGCQYGRPRAVQPGKSETVLNGKTLVPYATSSVHHSDGRLRGVFHCPCGDRFEWVPPHRDAIALGIAVER